MTHGFKTNDSLPPPSNHHGPERMPTTRKGMVRTPWNSKGMPLEYVQETRWEEDLGLEEGGGLARKLTFVWTRVGGWDRNC